ncbi:ABC transporter substrate-binding protein [Virgibacillus ndiopensis]|uniref:ABC transporter substrate-binding protein n=1 Tax=Virgibacillus ndiopensis TaxID=2004408 RepID=UPI000C084DF1|nr:ABC transporter substrate-binding protein [Virgibacillus ndiopensis]
MRKNKLLVVLISLFTLVILMAGCKGTGPEGESAGAESDKTESGKTVIDFWVSWGDGKADWFNKWIDKYNESQDEVEVKATFIAGDAWDQKVKAAQAAGTGPDVMTMNYGSIVFSAQQGKIQPLDEYVDPAIFEDLHDFANEFVSFDGKHYAYPFNAEPGSILLYRKDFFEEAGLDPEQPPETWDELIEYGKKLSKDGRYGLTAAGNTNDLAWSHWGLQAMTGQLPINEDWSEATINNEGYKKLFKFWNTLYEEGIFPKQQPGMYTEIQPLVDGRTAMMFNGSFTFDALRNEYADVVDKIGVAPLPTPDGNYKQPTSAMGGWTFVVDGNSKHPEEAAKFIEWFLGGDPEIMVDFFELSNFSSFTGRKSVDEALKDHPQASNDEWRKILLEKVIPYAVPEPIHAWEISLAYANALERVYLQGQDIDESLKQAEKEINDYIEANDYAGTNPRLQ